MFRFWQATKKATYLQKKDKKKKMGQIPLSLKLLIIFIVMQ